MTYTGVKLIKNLQHFIENLLNYYGIVRAVRSVHGLSINSILVGVVLLHCS